MDDVNTALRQAVDNIGQIVRHDGGALDFSHFDPTIGELVVTFRTAPNDECTACTIDEATVRAFLEEAVALQGVAMTALRIETAAAHEAHGDLLAGSTSRTSPVNAEVGSLRLDVLNPTADKYGTDVAGLAARPAGLPGQTVGLLWNGKPNGDIALRAIGAELESQFDGLRTRFYSGSIPCDRTLLDLVAAECSAVVACTADCGSCSSWMTHDAIALERAGVPAVIVVSKGFEEDVEASARAFALPDVQSVVVPQVYNNATVEASVEQSLDAVPAIIDRLTSEFQADAGSHRATRSAPVLSFAADSPTELFAEFNQYFMDHDWGDGYPLLPPTQAAVDSLLRDIAEPDQLLYTLPPGNGQVTPRKIAVACAMAGATAPELAVVEAVLRAFNDPEHNQRLRTVLMSTSAHAPFVLVNGPIARVPGHQWGAGVHRPRGAEPGEPEDRPCRHARPEEPRCLVSGRAGHGHHRLHSQERGRHQRERRGEPLDAAPRRRGTRAEREHGDPVHHPGRGRRRVPGPPGPLPTRPLDQLLRQRAGRLFLRPLRRREGEDIPERSPAADLTPHAHALAEGGISKDAFRDLLFEHGHQPLPRVIEQWRKLYLDGKTFPEWSWAFELSEEEQQRETLPSCGTAISTWSQSADPPAARTCSCRPLSRRSQRS